MKLMLVGLPEKDAEALWASIGDLAENGGSLRDWKQMETAVQQTQPDVVGVYLGARPGQVLALITRVRAMHPAAQYLAITEEADRSIVASVTDAGCSDLVVLKECPKDLRRALKVIANRDRPPTADGIATCILGAKGGVGTTAIAANLAAELANNGKKRVILVDLHLYLGDAAVVLDLRPRPSVLWFLTRGAVADARTWAEAPPMHKAGFRLLGLDGDMTTADPVSAEQVVFLVERLRERFEHVVIDAGSEINEVSLAACSAADQRIIAFTNDLAARSGAKRRVAALKDLDIGPIPAKAVLNRTQNFTEESREELERTVNVPVVGAISNAWRDVQGALERGQVLRQCAPRSQATRDFEALVEHIGGQGLENRRARTFFNFFR